MKTSKVRFFGSRAQTASFIAALARLRDIPLPYFLTHPLLPRAMQPMRRDRLLKSEPLSNAFRIGPALE